MRSSLLPFIGVGFGLLLLTRHPGVLLHAEFWGEDGWVWYPDAYNVGWLSLLKPWVGYLQTSSRLVALLVQPFPLAWAPTLFAAAGLVVQILPAVFLVSSRMDRVWPSLWARFALALVYIALPNSYELYVTLTNAQWHLATLAFLVLVSDPPEHWTGRAFDGTVLIISGLSGPFCLFLLPVACWQMLGERSRTGYRRAALVFATSIVQGGIILATAHSSRSGEPLGASVETLARIFSLQIFFGSVLGYRTMPALLGWQPWQTTWFPFLVATAGVLLWLAAFISGPSLLRKACLFATLLLIAALLHPQVSLSVPQWTAMTQPLAGDRYFVIPMVVWIGALFSLSTSTIATLRYASMLLLAAMAIVAIPRDWRVPHMPPTRFVEQAHAFEIAAPGTRMSFDIHPPGASPMVLVKRNSDW